jgi:uncharacterized membrane protein YccF (DUF307 family)
VRLILNIVWFVLAGLWMAIAYAIATLTRWSRSRWLRRSLMKQ